jgi:CO/xanthine dehydrogenase Mo-binding subunit
MGIKFKNHFAKLNIKERGYKMTISLQLEKEIFYEISEKGRNDYFRIDAERKAKGEIKYTSDLIEVNALYVKVFRSNVPHALIESLNIQDALSVPGVVKVLTYNDIPGDGIIGFFTRDQPLLAKDKVRYIGDPIALIVAETPLAAMEAMERIKVSYKPLPAVLSIDEALNPNSVKIHDRGNIKEMFTIKRGDIQRGEKESHVIVEGRYDFGYQEHAYLETEACLAIPTSDGIVAIGSMQVPFSVEKAIRTVLGNAVKNVRVIQAPTGGGFGGKEDAPDEVCAQAALAAWATGKPAFLMFNRRESICCHPKRHPGYIIRKLGATKDGKLKLLVEDIYLDGGAYMSLSPRVLFQAVMTAPGPYYIPNLQIKGVAVYTNKVPAGAFRGFGKPQSQFAAEVQMEELARELGMDPAELRLINIVHEGDELISGRLQNGVGAEQCIKKAMEISDWKKKIVSYPLTNSTKVRGIGMASVIHGTSIGPLGIDVGAAIVELDEEGNILIKNSLTEYGQGIMTGWTDIVKNALNVDGEIIKVLYPDTSIMYDSGPTVASRSTVVGGRALLEATLNFKSELIRFVSTLTSINPTRLSIEHNYVTDIPEKRLKITLKEIAENAKRRGIIIKGESWYNNGADVYWDRDKGVGKAWKSYSFATHIAEVEVDTETGEVKVLNYYAVHDSGKIINKKLAETQVYGGVIQGLGYALMEDLIVKDGKVLNDSFLDYMVPTFADTPNINVSFIETYNIDGPFGAKGLGEVPIEPVAAAIVNAVSNAIGKKLRAIPITPERVLTAIRGEL